MTKNTETQVQKGHSVAHQQTSSIIDSSKQQSPKQQSSYARLVARIKEAGILNSVQELLAWDEEVTMPSAGIHRRSLEKGVIAALHHRLATDDTIGILLAQASQEILSPEQQAMVREIAFDYTRFKNVPEALVKEIEEVATLATEVWKVARKHNDFQHFAPYLERLIDLKRKEATAIDPSRDPYAVLVEGYESGMSVAEMKEHFTAIKKVLVPLIATIQKRPVISTAVIKKTIAPSVQMEFNKKVAEYIGYDFSKGRIDIAVHPFSACWGRITTRFTDDYANSIGSTMHEAGHAFYDQGLLHEHMGTPLGEARSLSIHESQSRLWENHVGKSRAFWQGLFPKLQQAYGLKGSSVDEFYRAINVVQPGLIRVNADEVTYTLHVILRFELEEELLAGRLKVKDLPSEWNRRMKEYLGVTVPSDSDGVLQDTHWASGLIGYFPTYTLGSMIAAQLFVAARTEYPMLEQEFAAGNVTTLHRWLQKNIWDHGRRYSTKELVQRATGDEPNPRAYLTYLQKKYGELYGIND